MKDVTIQDCEECKDRFCREHIAWDEASHRWICDKCLRDLYGLKRGKAQPRAEGKTA